MGRHNLLDDFFRRGNRRFNGHELPADAENYGATHFQVDVGRVGVRGGFEDPMKDFHVRRLNAHRNRGDRRKIVEALLC